MAIRGPLDIFLMCRARTNAISVGVERGNARASDFFRFCFVTSQLSSSVHQ